MEVKSLNFKITMPKETYIFKFTGEVKDGKLTLDKKDKFTSHMKEFEGQKIELTLRKAVKSRSNAQVRYYFGVMVKMIQREFKELGTQLTIDEVHDFLKSMFLFREIVNEQTSEIYKVPMSLSTAGEVSTFNMSEYIDNVQRWASENLNLYIPSPNEDFVVDDRYYTD